MSLEHLSYDLYAIHTKTFWCVASSAGNLVAITPVELQPRALQTKPNTLSRSRVCWVQRTSERGSRESTSLQATASTTPTWSSVVYSRSVRCFTLCLYVLYHGCHLPSQFTILNIACCLLVSLLSGVWCLQSQAAGVQQQGEPVCPGGSTENHPLVERPFVPSGQHPGPSNRGQSPQFQEQCHLLCCYWSYQRTYLKSRYSFLTFTSFCLSSHEKGSLYCRILFIDLMILFCPATDNILLLQPFCTKAQFLNGKAKVDLVEKVAGMLVKVTPGGL